MANDRLRATITAAGLSYDSVAERVGVDPKTVQRWVLTDRIPQPVHRRAATALLERDETFLWPDLLADPRVRAASEAEVVRVYPTRGAVPPELWTWLLGRATKELSLLSYAGLFLLDNNPDITGLLKERAQAGVRVRILLADPSSPEVQRRGEEEGIGAGMQGRVQLAHRYLKPALGVPGLEVRLHTTTLYNSIYLSDAAMLVNMHVYGSGAPANPVMHLQRVDGGHLFESYRNSLERVWDGAVPVDEL